MTLGELAKIAGVSISTVSKVLNGKDESISEKTRKKVLEIAKEYKYVPYSNIRYSNHSKKFVIGILLFDSDLYPGFVEGIIKEANKHGYTIIYNMIDYEFNKAKSIIKSYSQIGVDAILWSNINDKYDKVEEIIKEFEILSIPFDCYGANGIFNYNKLSYTLTEELIKLGHKNILCFPKGENRSILPSHCHR